MKYRKLGQSDLSVSVVSFGCWAIGKKDWGRVDDSDSIKAIKRALDAGINFFDTAPIYGFGHSEEVLAQGLEGERKNVLIATKCGLRRTFGDNVASDGSSEFIFSEIDQSLKRLKTDYIDLYQVHWPDTNVPFKSTMEALMKLKKQGKIREIGVSNFSKEQMEESLRYAEIISLQPRYNMLEREIEKDIIPFCEKRNISIICYEPLLRGLFSGKFSSRTKFEQNDIRCFDERFRGKEFERHLEFVEILKKLASRTDLAPSSLAICFCLLSKTVASAICGMKTAAQVAENAGAGDVDLDEWTVSELMKIIGEFEK
jgi:aryl-alcohol dehydrogenase-like predicted oxidoreductase